MFSCRLGSTRLGHDKQQRETWSGANVSSRRYKHDIQSIYKASEATYALKPVSFRYEQINAMLLNEFLKEHGRGEEQDCKIQQQETTIAVAI